MWLTLQFRESGRLRRSQVRELPPPVQVAITACYCAGASGVDRVSSPLSLSYCRVLLSLSFESCKTGLIQYEFMPGWPCAKCDLSSKVRRFDSVSWSVSFVYDCVVVVMMFILLSSWHLIPIASRNFATWIDWGIGYIIDRSGLCVFLLSVVVFVVGNIRQTATKYI